MRTEWTDDRNNEFRRLWRHGLTDSELAVAFGVSRHAVVGKRMRLGLPCNKRRQASEDAALADAAP